MYKITIEIIFIIMFEILLYTDLVVSLISYNFVWTSEPLIIVIICFRELFPVISKIDNKTVWINDAYAFSI